MPIKAPARVVSGVDWTARTPSPSSTWRSSVPSNAAWRRTSSTITRSAARAAQAQLPPCASLWKYSRKRGHAGREPLVVRDRDALDRHALADHELADAALRQRGRRGAERRFRSRDPVDVRTERVGEARAGVRRGFHAHDRGK